MIPGLSHVDHVGLTVPDLEQAVRFFADHFGAEELYRSRRGPDAASMPETFEVPADAALELSMMRMPPNLNLELFQWTGDGRSSTRPRPCDAGGNHLCVVVDDVDDAVAYLEGVPGVRMLGAVKQVGDDSPHVAGNRWIYLVTPWGQQVELVDRSRVDDPPRFVGPDEWSTS